MKVYFESRDWWIGYYRGDFHHYVCLLPTVVIRWRRHGGSASREAAELADALRPVWPDPEEQQ